MKNPIRFLCASIDGHPLSEAASTLRHPLVMAAGGLCAASVLVFVWSGGSPERDTAKQTEAAHTEGEKASSGQPDSLFPYRRSELGPGTVQDEAAMAVLHQGALQDSAAALRWAEAFSQPSLRDLTASLNEVR